MSIEMGVFLGTILIIVASIGLGKIWAAEEVTASRKALNLADRKNQYLQDELRLAEIDVSETALVNDQLRVELEEYEEGSEIEIDISLEEEDE